MRYDELSMEQIVTDDIKFLENKVENESKSSLVEAETAFCQWMVSINHENRRESLVKKLPWPTKQVPEVKEKNLFYSTLKIVGDLSEQGRIEFAEYFWKNKNDFIGAFCGYNPENFSELKDVAIYGVNWDNPECKPLNNMIVDYFTGAFIDKNGYEQEAHRLFFGDCATIESNVIFPLVLMGLADKEEQKMIEEGAFGYILARFSPPDVINEIRSMIDKSESQENKIKLEKLAAKVQGLMEGVTVHTSLESVYRSVRFEKYPVSEHTRPIRKEFLENLMKGMSRDDQVLDVASGTGWLVDVLKNELGMRNVWGVDVNIKNLEKAKNAFGEYFSASSWEKLPFSTNQFPLVTCLGRSLPHTENERSFVRALHELNRVTAVDGYLVFDMPSSKDGEYAENIDRFKAALRNLGCPDSELIDLPYVVDSPDDKNFYNRFVPKREWIEKELKRLNFEVTVIEEDIPNEKGEPSGNINLVFVCKKR